MRRYANCKINIGLDILRKREDGYHELETLMVPVEGLYDVIDIEKIEGTTPTFISKGLVIDCPPEQNICLKAWELLHRKHGIGAAQITLDKRVPFGAGLGGGSSDATVTLLLLNEIFELSLSEEQLISLAAELGSDTAFFVRNTPQLCTSRGEVMTPFEIDLSGMTLVVVKPDAFVSTKEAFSGIKPHTPETPLSQRLQRPRSEWQQIVKNDFESHIFKAHPTIEQAKNQLIEMGAIYASMSGSGSSVYGLFEGHKKSEMFCNISPFVYHL